MPKGRVRERRRQRCPIQTEMPPECLVEHLQDNAFLSKTVCQRLDDVTAELEQRDVEGVIKIDKKRTNNYGPSILNPFRYACIRKLIHGPVGSWREIATLECTKELEKLEPVTRSYDADFLRIPVGDERGCIHGSECCVHRIPGWPSNQCLREWYLPSSLAICRTQRAWPDNRQPCLLCTLMHINKVYFNARAEQSPPPPTLNLSRFYHRTDVDGEYRSIDCIQTHERCYSGLWGPVLLFRTHHYRIADVFVQDSGTRVLGLECIAPLGSSQPQSTVNFF